MKRILIVDDEAAIRRVVVRVLTDLGAECVECADGLEAMASLDSMLAQESTRAQESARTEDPLACDLVITDLEMPRADGFALIRHVESLPRAPKVIVISGSAALAEVQQRHAKAVVGCLAKPFRPAELAELVRACLGGNDDRPKAASA